MSLVNIWHYNSIKPIIESLFGYRDRDHYQMFAIYLWLKDNPIPSS